MSEQTISVKSNTNIFPSVDDRPREFDAASLEVASAPVKFVTKLTVISGKCYLTYSYTGAVGRYDFVGLYNNGGINNPHDARTWKYCSELPPDANYATGIDGAVNMVAMYWAFDYRRNGYVRLAVSEGLTAAIINNGGTVQGSTTC
jgi:hypothetical protein